MQPLVYAEGYITHSVTKKFELCDTCRESLQAELVEQNDQLLKLKSYHPQSQPRPLTCPLCHIVSLLQHADNVFPVHEPEALTVSHLADKCFLGHMQNYKQLSTLP